MKDTQLISKLQKAGLKEKEAIVYASLLELGGGFPSKIAEYSALNRSTVYKILLDLSIKGLVTELKKKNKIFYQIDKPHKLVRYTKQKIRIAEDEMEQAQKILPDIEGLFAGLENKPKVRFFEGVDGVKSVYEDHILQEKKYEMLGVSNTSKLRNFLPEKFMFDHVKMKEKKGITTRGILPNTDMDYNESVYKHVDKKIWPKLKFVSTEIFFEESEITIYGENKVSLINFGNKNPIAIIIEDKTIYNMMKMMFELAWAGVDG